MLRFNPENCLTFTPNPEEKLESTFIISNPSNNCSAPFKVKSTNPDLFRVSPHLGLIAPLQQVRVTVATIARASGDLAKQLARDHKFRIEYSMLERPPYTITEALARITDENKQTHKLYIGSPGSRTQDHSDAKSSLSNRYTYRTVRDENEDPTVNRFEQGQSSQEERFQSLKEEINQLEKERSEVIMASRPSRRLNLLTALLILLFMLIVGNLTGKLAGLSPAKTARPRRKPREYRYFGLEKLWAGEQATEVEEAPWWQFWN